MAAPPFLPMNLTSLCYCLAPFSSSLTILCLGGREERGKGNPRTEKGKNIPGWRKRQRLPATSIQQNPQQNLSGSEGKVQRPGRARPRAGAPPATLTQPEPATPSTTSSVRSSEAARPSGSCLGTWTMSQPKPPLAERDGAWQGEHWGQGPTASPGGPRMHAVQDATPRTRWEDRGRRGTGRKGDREKEAGLDQLPSPFPSPSPEAGCPTLPKVLCRVTAGRG